MPSMNTTQTAHSPRNPHRQGFVLVCCAFVLLGCGGGGGGGTGQPCDPDTYPPRCDGPTKVWCGEARGSLYADVRQEECVAPLGRCEVQEGLAVCTPSAETCDPSSYRRSCVDGATLRNCSNEVGDGYGATYRFPREISCVPPLTRCSEAEGEARCAPPAGAVACDPDRDLPRCNEAVGQTCRTGETGDPAAPTAAFWADVDCRSDDSQRDHPDDRTCAVSNPGGGQAPWLRCVFRIEECVADTQVCIDGQLRNCFELEPGRTALLSTEQTCR